MDTNIAALDRRAPPLYAAAWCPGAEVRHDQALKPSASSSP